MRVELHCHSVCSDGTDDPEEVARQAARSGVRIFCLTDHDTVAGSDRARGAAEGMRVLTGMELSSVFAGRTVHLLVYGLGRTGTPAPLMERVSRQREERRRRIHEICARLRRCNVELDPGAILAAAGGATPGRPHVARALVAAGACGSLREAFVRYLGDGAPADVPASSIEAEEGVALARAAGARVSLAHPHTVGAPAIVESLCARLVPAGLGGLEAVNALYPARVREDWTELADRLGLVVTAGSDYHGAAVLPEVTRPGVELDDRRASRLEAWLAC